jgi:transcriptional regulator with XRE-family HTH domain
VANRALELLGNSKACSSTATRSASLTSLLTGPGLTQAQLARLLRKPQSFVSNYERGQRRIDVLELLRIVEALKGDARAVFMDIVARRGETKLSIQRALLDRTPQPLLAGQAG